MYISCRQLFLFLYWLENNRPFFTNRFTLVCTWQYICGNDNFPVINYKNDPLNTNCTENWKRNGLLDPIWKSLLNFFFFYIKKINWILTYHLHISIANKYISKASTIFQRNLGHIAHLKKIFTCFQYHFTN